MFISSLTRGSLLSLSAVAIPLLLASAACSGAAGTESSAQESESASAISSVPVRNTSAAVPCEGALPDVCEICSDGKEECAHWVREDGK